MPDAASAPKTILRGHGAQVHAAVFIRDNERLATGDADGHVVLWDLTIARPRAVWKAHDGAILGIRGWGRDKIITHGRDLRLVVWQLGEEHEERLSASLPLEDTLSPRPKPWILHLLEVNTMNFCAFAACSNEVSDEGFDLSGAPGIYVAVPNTLASDAVDIYALPSQVRVHTVRPGKDTGMAMSLSLFHLKGSLTLVAAFENGYTTVQRLQPSGTWAMTYRAKAHSQPVLSLDVHPDLDYFFTSSADAIIARHPVPTARQELTPDFDPRNRIIEEVEADEESGTPPAGSSLLSAQLKGEQSSRGHAPKASLKEWEYPLDRVDTKHAGQQGLRIRSDGRIFATAGWDSKVRVYSCKTMKELAVLQWRKVGCYAVAFAGVSEATPGSAGSAPSAESTAGDSGPLMARGATSVKSRRLHRARTAHWIAAGAKDGKVSMWDIY